MLYMHNYIRSSNVSSYIYINYNYSIQYIIYIYIFKE